VEPVTERLRVVVDGITIADTNRGHRVLETSQPPAYYFPPDDVSFDHLVPSTARTFCEWKGSASYWSATVDGRVVDDIAWAYAEPRPGFEAIAGHLAFYAQKATHCYVGDERVEANEGSFYGGWITSRVVGPFKGGAGSAHW
jgi:uncharacterized protein (DUF427 family)